MTTYEKITTKILSIQQTGDLFSDSFRKKHQIVFTNGCFDLLHRGHIYYLARAREMGDLLVVGLNSDDSVSRLKGAGRPLNNQQARAEVLAALSAVDYVIIFPEDTPLKLINIVKPRFLVKGGDYRTSEIVGYREVTGWGGSVLTIPLLQGYSTSSIIQRKP